MTSTTLANLLSNPNLINQCMKDWKKSGEKSFIQACKDGSWEQACSHLCDLILKFCTGEGKLDMITRTYHDFEKLFKEQPGYESDMVDSLWFLDSIITDFNDKSTTERFFHVLEFFKDHLSTAIMMERLSEETLQTVSLISSKDTFQKRYVRSKTRVFFKQRKFNLLREESEGYAKLLTLLCQTNGPAEQTMKQIWSLIGYFDLDPNRVLDIILDVCEQRTEAHKLFVEIVRAYNPDKKDLTAFIGRKFLKDFQATINKLTYRLAALFITHNLADMDLLLSYLTPSNDEMQVMIQQQVEHARNYRPLATSTLGGNASLGMSLNTYAENLAAASSSSGSGANAGGGVGAGSNSNLNNASSSNQTSSSGNSSMPGPGSLAGTSLGTGSSNAQSSGAGPGSAQNQAEVGSNNTLYLVSNVANDGYCFTTQQVCLNLLNPSGEESSTQISSVVAAASEDIDIAYAPGGKSLIYKENQKLLLCEALILCGNWNAVASILERFPTHWAAGFKPLGDALCQLLHFLMDPVYCKNNELPSSLMGMRKALTDLAYQSSGLADLIPKPCETVQELAQRVCPIAAHLGCFAARDPVLLTKLCRVFNYYFLHGRTDKNAIDFVYQAIFNTMDEVVLPALSLVNTNCALAEEAWSVLQHMPYYHRYRLYSQWKHVHSTQEPILLKNRAEILAKSRALLKRLSKDNVKPMGRQLGKISHGNPGILFDNVLQTIQMYSNLIPFVVESLKYCSNLSYDVLVFSIVEALASERQSMEESQTSQPLLALSVFTGQMCKKYQFELSGLLHYVLSQLKSGRCFDLVILREVINKMSGIDTSEDLTEEQLEAASGGELLLQEGGYYAQIRNTRRSASRLASVLIDHQIITPFLFLMAKMRDQILYLDRPDQHVKLAGRLYDECQGTLVQFITFLSVQLTREEMLAQFMPVDRMIREFNVPADTAFCLFRNVFEQQIDHLWKSRQQQQQDATDLSNEEAAKQLKLTAFSWACNHIVHDIVKSVRDLSSAVIWTELSPEFYVTFWCLSAGDLHVPEAAYMRQQLILKSQIESIGKNPEMTVHKRKREIERCQGLVEKLTRELQQRQEHQQRMEAWLLEQKQTWFQVKCLKKANVIVRFLQMCIYPRVFFTSMDAVFSAKFILHLHQKKTPRFSTLICLDQIFNDITLPVSMCTEDEAHRYGRFLCTLLDFVMRWHSSREIYARECSQFPGFVTVVSQSNDQPDETLSCDDYRQLVHKWHYRITKSLVACLDSGNYAQIRNALIVLTRVAPNYPKSMSFGNAVERRLNKVREEEKDKRPDLKTLACCCIGALKPFKQAWFSDENFNSGSKSQTVTPKQGTASGASTPATGKTKAPPTPTTISLGSQNVASSGNTPGGKKGVKEKSETEAAGNAALLAKKRKTSADSEVGSTAMPQGGATTGTGQGKKRHDEAVAKAETPPKKLRPSPAFTSQIKQVSPNMTGAARSANNNNNNNSSQEKRPAPAARPGRKAN